MSKSNDEEIMQLIESVAELRAQFMLLDKKSVAPQKYKEAQDYLRRMENLLNKKRKQRRDQARKNKYEDD